MVDRAVRTLSDFELAAGGGIIALIADVCWLIHDILMNGFTIYYTLVGIGLVIGILITGSAWIRHIKRKKQMFKDLYKNLGDANKSQGDANLHNWLDH